MSKDNGPREPKPEPVRIPLDVVAKPGNSK